MAGKHRKISKPAAVVAAVVAPGGIAAAALAVSGFSPGVVASPAEPAPPSAVDLLAVITPANSTAQIFAGATYYNTDFTKPPFSTIYGPQKTVPFFLGPSGIADAIKAADADPNDNRSIVLASGWGAGQTGTALATLDSDDLDEIDLVVLDNNTNRAGGGFWTTYAPFAPLLGTSAEPTRNDLDVTVVDVAYEYNINSDAPVDPLNPLALGNSLAAYAYDYGAQSTTEIPTKDMEGNALKPGMHYVVQDGKVVEQYAAPGTTDNPNTSTIFITVKSDNLPLTRPLRLIPGGDILADAIDPTMTELVNAGYNDRAGIPGEEAIPVDPGKPRPMQPGSSLTGLGGVPRSVPIGLAKGADTAGDDISDPTTFVSKPIDEAGKLPVISGLSPTALTNQSVSSNTRNAGSPKTLLPGLQGGGNNNSSSGSATTGSNGLKNFTDKINDAVNKVTGGLTGAKPAGKSDDSQ